RTGSRGRPPRGRDRCRCAVERGRRCPSPGRRRLALAARRRTLVTAHRILPSVLVYLCRHAAAAPGDPDELRPLTPEGTDQARRLGERLAAKEPPPAVVVSSPLVRARRTAELIAG